MSAPVSQTITRRSASNLALAFVLLPAEKRRAMASLYAFCRLVDDVADEDAQPVEVRRAQLAAWEQDLASAYLPGTQPKHPVIRELQPAIHRYQLPQGLFTDLLRGVEMDLNQQRYRDRGELDTYCYRVASAVGLLSIEIFGYQNPACRHYAIWLGKALQTTNILRDVKNDADRGRIYLPLEDLDRFHVTADEILQHRYSDRFRALAIDLALHARQCFHRAREFLPLEDRRSMIAAELMGSVYWELLTLLEARQFNVFSPETLRLPRSRKVLLTLRTWWRVTAHRPTPNYGDPNPFT